MPKKGRNIYKRKDGRWEGRLYVLGNHKYKSVYGKSYTDVRDKLQLINPVSLTASCRLNFTEIMQQWLDSTRARIKESSFSSYSDKLRLHLMPYYKDIRYDKITPAEIERFIADKLSAGLSTKYVSDMVMIMKSAAKWAERTYGYINRISSVGPPKVIHQEPDLLSAADQKKLQAELLSQNDLTSCGIYLAVFTGLRIGELCGLRWEDIDFEKKLLTVKRTVHRISSPACKGKTAVKITPPKSENSIRQIPLPDFLLTFIQKFARPEGFVLSGDSSPVEPRCLSYRFKQILKRAGLPQVKFHSLRHTFATNCLQSDFDVKTLSEILGHANMKTTMKIYVHSSLERKQACMSKLRPAR